MSRLPQGQLVTAPRTSEQIMAMFKDLDSETMTALQRSISFFGTNEHGRPRQFLEDIFTGFFVNMRVQAENYDWNTITRLPSGERCLVAFIIGEIARHLKQEVPSDAFGSGGEFAENCLRTMETAASLMINSFNEKKYQVEAGILVLNYAPSDTTVIVDKTVYSAFLEAGGTPEIILGAKTGGLALYTAEEISNNAVTCAKSWSMYSTLNNSTVDNEERDYLRAAYKATFSELMEDGPAFEKEVRSADPSLAERLVNEAYVFINDQRIDQLRDFVFMMENLIARIRFGYTPTCFFIKEMRACKKDNPKSTNEEDATVATIKYLVAYIMTQVTKTHV